MTVGGVVVVAKDSVATKAGGGQGVEQGEDVGQTFVVVEKVASMDEQVVFDARTRLADGVDLGSFAPVCAAEVGVGEVEQAQACGGQVLAGVGQADGEVIEADLHGLAQDGIGSNACTHARKEAGPADELGARTLVAPEGC